MILNVFFLGIIAGHFLRIADRSPHPSAIEAGDFNLTEAQTQQIKEYLHAAHLENQVILELVQEEKKNALQILRSKPFDEDAYQSSIDNIHILRGQAVQHITETLKEWVPSLSKDERAAVAAILSKPPPIDQ
jgi:uncharacterized membrane protein